MNRSALTVLSPLETRVLGVLVEKQLTTPDYYPLTLNALVAGCSQKSNRNPVMHVSEEEVQMALDALKRQSLVIDSYGASGRVMRYAHNLPKVLDVGQQMTALLAALMLRGPQTPGELRTGCDRMYRFADISSVEAFLEDMAARPVGALVVKLPKQPGSREHRWAQLLSGPVEADQATHGPAEPEEVT
ncbi:MAG TPA: YceH family protein, partial [Burkholderiales bacterium]|nr:YceH family protein [Burkholderiales bacterium]